MQNSHLQSPEKALSLLGTSQCALSTGTQHQESELMLEPLAENTEIEL